MNEIKANHYTECLIYSIDKVLREVKAELNQYISNVEPNITAEQFVVLDTIYCNEDICQQDVAKILYKDKSNIKRMVEILENKKYIVRKTGRKNNRLVNYLAITDAGRKLVDRIIEQVKEHIKHAFSNITDEEIDILKNIISKLD